MAAKKLKVKAAAATKPSAGKPAPAPGASTKAVAKKSAPPKAATSKATAKPAATKATAGKPVALQTVAKKATTPKAPVKKPAKNGKDSANAAALNGRAQSPIETKPTDSETFYFVVGHMDAHISNQRSSSANEIASSESFDEVKDKAVDHLIELVDLLERRLWEIKRAQDFASYLALRELS